VEHELERRLRLFGLGLHAAGLAIVVLVAAAGQVCLLRPVASRIDACEATADQLEARLSTLGNRRAEHEELMRRSAVLAKDTAVLAKRVPAEALEAEFLSQVSATASQVGMKILDYRPAEANSQEDCSRMEIRLSCSGPYRSLCGFFDRLSAFDRLSRVTEAEITSAGTDGCSVQMTLVIYFHLKRPAESKSLRTAEGGIARG